MEKLDCYYINKATCAILPVDTDISKVIELDCSYIVNKSTKAIIDDSCKYFGSSYQGRFEGSKKILNMNYKLPIVVEEYNDLIFFPTSSPRFGECCWISLNNTKSYSRDDLCSKIYFYGNNELLLNISYYSLENQLFRASMLQSLLVKRKNM